MSAQRAEVVTAGTQPAPRDIEIISDGLAVGTTIAVDGDPIDSVTKVEWSVEVGEASKATLYCHFLPVNLKSHEWRVIPSKGTSFRVRLRLAWAVLRGER